MLGAPESGWAATWLGTLNRPDQRQQVPAKVDRALIRRFEKVADAVGISKDDALDTASADPTFPRITAHDLRHTAASLAISAGANVKAVQRMLGHASAAMTLDVYADLFDSDVDAVRRMWANCGRKRHIRSPRARGSCRYQRRYHHQDRGRDDLRGNCGKHAVKTLLR